MSSNNEYKLTEITDLNALRALRDLYLQDWPAHCVGYYCLDNFIQWLNREPQINNLQFLTINGDWQSEGLVLIIDRYQLFVNSLNKSNTQSVTRAISLLDWSGGFKVSSILQCLRPAVLSVVQQKQLKLEYDSLTLMYYMPQAQAAKLEVNCPTGFKVSPLTIDDAKTVDDLWPNRHQGSLYLIKRLIAWNANMGIFTADTQELVAWCLRLQGGFLGALQVKDSHKRLGLGSVVTRATARCIAELGHDVMALVSSENAPSRGMFDKLDFKVTDTCYWLRTYPTIENYMWPEGT